MANRPLLKCPKCKAAFKRLRATGKIQGMYDERIELTCRKCRHQWMSTSAQALPLLQKQRKQD